MKILLDVNYIENKFSAAKPKESTDLDSSGLVKILENECNPYNAGHDGVLAYLNDKEVKYLFSTSLGNGSETAFDINGSRILDTRKLPKIIEELVTPYLIKDVRGYIIHVSKQEFDVVTDYSKKV